MCSVMEEGLLFASMDPFANHDGSERHRILFTLRHASVGVRSGPVTCRTGWLAGWLLRKPQARGPTGWDYRVAPSPAPRRPPDGALACKAPELLKPVRVHKVVQRDHRHQPGCSHGVEDLAVACNSPVVDAAGPAWHDACPLQGQAQAVTAKGLGCCDVVRVPAAARGRCAVVQHVRRAYA